MASRRCCGSPFAGTRRRGFSDCGKSRVLPAQCRDLALLPIEIPLCAFVLDFGFLLKEQVVNVQVLGSVEMERTEKVHIVGIKASVSEELVESFPDEINTLFGCINEFGILLVKGDKPMPEVLFSILCSFLDCLDFFLGEHTVLIEDAGALLQILEHRELCGFVTVNLAFGRHILVDIVLAGQIEEGAILSVDFNFSLRRVLRQFVWRVGNIKDDRCALFFDLFSPFFCGRKEEVGYPDSDRRFAGKLQNLSLLPFSSRLLAICLSLRTDDVAVMDQNLVQALAVPIDRLRQSIVQQRPVDAFRQVHT